MLNQTSNMQKCLARTDTKRQVYVNQHIRKQWETDDKTRDFKRPLRPLVVWQGIVPVVHNSFKPSIPGICSRSTATLTKIKQLLKMSGYMMRKNIVEPC